MNSLQPKQAASEPAPENTGAQEPPQEGEKPKKQTAQERIAELANRRREAEDKAAAAEQRAAELERRLQALEAKAPTPEVSNEPKRSDFPTEEAFLDAKAAWIADKRIADKLRADEEARMAAEQAEVVAAFESRQQKAMKEIDDYTEVLSNSAVIVPDYLMPSLMESEVGPLIAYYLAKNPDEAKKLTRMRPAHAMRHLVELEREIATDPAPAAASNSPQQRPRAPEPISPVRGSPASPPGAPKTFAEYKAKRLAEQAARR